MDDQFASVAPHQYTANVTAVPSAHLATQRQTYMAFININAESNEDSLIAPDGRAAKQVRVLISRYAAG